MERKLIVNADDYGLTPGVSRGILHAHRVGIVTSTTYMVNFPWAEEHVADLLQTPTLGVGLHVNLATGAPVSAAVQVPHLAPGGQLQKSFLRLSRVPQAEVERELRAQLLRFQRLLGRLPTHLDTHRYTQALPVVARALARVAREHDLPVRRIRPGELPGGWLSPVLRPYLRAAEAIFQQAGVRGPQGILVGDFDQAMLVQRLARLRPGVTEIVTHPAVVDDALRAISSLTAPREVERRALTDPVTRALVRQSGIRLLHFGQLEG